MKIILSLFIILNIFIFLYGMISEIPFNKIHVWFKRIYGLLFIRTITVLKGSIFHPISFIKFIITLPLRLVFWMFELIAPFFMFIVPLIIIIFAWYFTITNLNLFILLELGICFLITIILFVIYIYSSKIWDYLNLKVILCSCYLRQLNRNVFEYSYETLLGNEHLYKKSPKDYCEERRKDVENSNKRINDNIEYKRKHPEIKKEAKRKKSYLDILYPDELQMFDLYMKDFTIDDLNKKRKELLKAHHPDNYHTEKEIRYHQEIYNKIQKAYEIIKKEKEVTST